MAKISDLKSIATSNLLRRKALLLRDAVIPADLIRASYVSQYLTCGKPNCRCRKGHKHGPFRYLVQCLSKGTVRKFLLKTAEHTERAEAAIAAYAKLQARLNELSTINTELLRRGESLQPGRGLP